MILDLLMDLVFSVVTTVVGWLPTITFDFGSGVGALHNYLGWVGGYVDLGAWAAVLGVIVAAEVLVWGVQFLIWLYRKVPVFGGH